MDLDIKDLFGIMHDRVAANLKAVRIFQNRYLVSVKSMACWSHTCDHVGDKFATNMLHKFLKSFNALISRSLKIKDVFQLVTGEYIRKPSDTRWWSAFEQIVQIMSWSDQLQAVDQVLHIAVRLELCKETATKMLKLLSDPL